MLSTPFYFIAEPDPEQESRIVQVAVPPNCTVYQVIRAISNIKQTEYKYCFFHDQCIDPNASFDACANMQPRLVFIFTSDNSPSQHILSIVELFESQLNAPRFLYPPANPSNFQSSQQNQCFQSSNPPPSFSPGQPLSQPNVSQPAYQSPPPPQQQPQQQPQQRQLPPRQQSIRHPSQMLESAVGLTKSSVGLESAPKKAEIDIQPGFMHVYTTATVHSFMEGDQLQISPTEPYSDVYTKVKDHSSKLLGDKPCEVLLYIGGGIPYIEGTIKQWYDSIGTALPVIYAVVTRPIPDDIFSMPIVHPADYSTDEMKVLLSPMEDTSQDCLSQIACILGYINHNGNKSEEFVDSCMSITPFIPLSISLNSLQKGDNLYGSTIATITSSLRILFRSILPITVKDQELFRYATNCCCFFAHTESPHIESLLEDISLSSSYPTLTQYVKSHGLSSPVYIFIPDLHHEKFDRITVKPKDMLAIENCFNSWVSFKPFPPLTIRNQHQACIVKGKDHYLLYWGEITAKDGDMNNLVNIYDPATAQCKQVDIEKFAAEIGEQYDQEAAQLVEPKNVKQINYVCFDESLSMIGDLDGYECHKDDQIPRVTIATQYLTTFANLTYGYRIPSIQGMLSFNKTITERAKLSPLVPNFEDGIKKVKPDGVTHLWDSIDFAAQKLIDFNPGKRTFPNAQHRIIVITDGEDINSSTKPHDVCNKCMKARIIVDAIILTREEGKWETLAAICHATGGFAFKPATIEEGLRIFETDVFLSLDVRKKVFRGSFKSITKEGLDSLASNVLFDDLESISKMDAIRQKSLQSGQFVTPKYAIFRSLQNPQTHPHARRIMQELKIINNCNDEDIAIIIEKSHLIWWRVFIRIDESQSTLYGGKWWYLAVNFTENYPVEPPDFRFISVPYHLNVSEEGHVCMDSLGKNYMPMFNMIDLIGQVKALMMCPNLDEPIQIEKRDLYRYNKNEFERRARNSTQTNAADDYHKWLAGSTVASNVPEGWDNVEMTRTKDPVPANLLTSSISGRIMKNPVKVSTGSIMDKNEAIQLLISNAHPIDPLTGLEMTDDPNDLQEFSIDYH